MTIASAIFHGVEVPESLLADELQNHRAATLAEARSMAGRALAAKAVLLARAAELDIDASPERNSQGQEETPEEALIRTVLSEEVEAPSVSEEAVRSVYDSGPDRFMSPPLLEASHILVAPAEPGATALEQARLKAVALISDLQTRPAGFAKLAANQSACPSAAEGGSLGQLRPGDVLPDIWTALSDMEPGTIRPEPVASEHGWHVLRLDHRSDGERLPFDYVRPHIAMQLEARAWTKAAAKYVDRLLAASTAEPGLCLGPDGRLTGEGGTVVRAGGLLGQALSDVNLAYDALAPAARARLDHAASSEHAAPTECLARTIRLFLSKADDEAWTQLVSCLRDSENPLADSLALIVKHQLPPVHATHTLIQPRTGAPATP
ncbi:peptidylprolyl isomerase [Maricaulis sp. CAU 1757]